MQSIGLIGGTGLDQWAGASATHLPDGPYGKASADLQEFAVNGLKVLFLARHGEQHLIPPHAINYRANIDLFKRMNVDGIIAVNAVGGISASNPPGALTLPDQLIDYTSDRAHSFSMRADDKLQHIDFSWPFEGPLRSALLQAARELGIELGENGCLGVMQGPRLETAAEIKKLKRDGCDMVGMTSMPEAALAREAGLDYACLCVNANWGAGLVSQPIRESDIQQVLKMAMGNVRLLLNKLFKDLGNAD